MAGNPAIPLVRVKNRDPLLFCKTCKGNVPYRISRYKELKGGRRVAIFVCKNCGAEI